VSGAGKKNISRKEKSSFTVKGPPKKRNAQLDAKRDGWGRRDKFSEKKKEEKEIGGGK